MKRVYVLIDEHVRKNVACYPTLGDLYRDMNEETAKPETMANAIRAYGCWRSTRMIKRYRVEKLEIRRKKRTP